MENLELVLKLIERNSNKELLIYIYELTKINGINKLEIDYPLIRVDSIGVVDFDDSEEEEYYYSFARHFPILNYIIKENNHYLLEGGYDSINEKEFIAVERLANKSVFVNDQDLMIEDQYFPEDVWLDTFKAINLYNIIHYELYIMMKSSKKYFVKNVKEYYGGILSFEAGIIGDVTEEDEKRMNLFNLVSSEINKHNNDE